MEENKLAKPTTDTEVVAEHFEELKLLLQLAWPTTITEMLRFLNPSISIMFCGHLSREELDAASLSCTIINVLGLSIDLGFSTAFDTIFSQIYGSKNQKLMGIYLQRALLVMSTVFLILMCLHINIEQILLKLHQDPLISSLTAEYLLYFLPGLACDFIFLVFVRYLQNQNIVFPMVIASMIGTAFDIICQFYFVYYLGYGLRASAFIMSLSYAVMLLVKVGYIIFSKLYVDTWNGFNLLAALDNWGVIFWLGIPGLFMLAMEEWCFEFATFVAGTLGDVVLGGQAIAFQVQSFVYMIPLGLATAVNIRVGQSLGAMNISTAKRSYRVSLIFIVFLAMLTGFPVIIFRNYIPLLFTSDVEVIHQASKILPMIFLFQFLEGLSGCSEAVLLACGRQVIGASIIFTGYYCIGIPVGLALTYYTSLSIVGMWIGLAMGFGMTAILYATLAMRTNWYYESRKAIRNVNRDNEGYRKLLEENDILRKDDAELIIQDDLVLPLSRCSPSTDVSSSSFGVFQDDQASLNIFGSDTKLGSGNASLLVTNNHNGSYANSSSGVSNIDLGLLGTTFTAAQSSLANEQLSYYDNMGEWNDGVLRNFDSAMTRFTARRQASQPHRKLTRRFGKYGFLWRRGCFFLGILLLVCVSVELSVQNRQTLFWIDNCASRLLVIWQNQSELNQRQLPTTTSLVINDSMLSSLADNDAANMKRLPNFCHMDSKSVLRRAYAWLADTDYYSTETTIAAVNTSTVFAADDSAANRSNSSLGTVKPTPVSLVDEPDYPIPIGEV